MPKPFLGVGVSFPIDVHDGALVLAQYEESVRQSIKIVLGTAKGERVMRPEFGCGIHDYVFAPFNATTSGRISQAVQEALLLFEPRIDVRDVQVTSGHRGRRLWIRIEYEVRATNNAFNLVYPFYLERSTGV